MLQCQNIFFVWKLTLVYLTIVSLDLTNSLRNNENLSVDELYEIYGLHNPFKKTKEELKYEKRREKLKSRWNFDIDVSEIYKYSICHVASVPECLRALTPHYLPLITQT
jgi:hypothetical protein